VLAHQVDPEGQKVGAAVPRCRLLTGSADVTGYDCTVTERAGDGVMPGPSDHLTDSQPPPDPVRPRESDRVDAGLRDRMERLPPGHPSSPYNDDGTHRPPEPDQSDREYPIPGDPDYRGDLPGTPDTAQPPEPITVETDATPDQPLDKAPDPAQPQDAPRDIEPLTDAEYADHVREIREQLDQAREQGLATDEMARDRDEEIWPRERAVFHTAIINDLYESTANVPNEYQAIMAGGLPGSGKSTILERYAGIDRSQFLTIDPDQIKKEMADRDLIPQVAELSPMEASDLVHEESSHIAKRIAHRAQADGKNVIWDITMSNRQTTEQRIDGLRSAGYTRIECIFVDISLNISEERAQARHRIGHDEYRAGKGEGGRLIPEDLIRGCRDTVWGSVNRRTFEEVKQRFDKWDMYDNSVDGRAPMLIQSSEREANRG
jgi:predicted ABC-type ATPase